MAWDSESLWAKACLFIERAFAQQDDDEQFGLWAALSLELLARSSLASVSPALLAEPDKEHSNLLHALGRLPSRNPRSIGVTSALQIAKKLFEGISDADVTLGVALVNKRNEELHSGAAAFEDYPTDKWLVGFHRLCDALCKAQNRSLSDYYGDEEAQRAEEMIQAAGEQTKSRVMGRIASHKNVFAEKSAEEKVAAVATAERSARELGWRGCRESTCPACGSKASISGEAYGKESVSLNEGEVTIRQPMIPRELKCQACELHLRDVGELDAAGLGGRYTSSSRVTAAEHFGLISPEDAFDYVSQQDTYQDE